MVGSTVDGSRRDGILMQETSGRFLHVTLRVPAHRLDSLYRFLDAAYVDEIVPNTSSVRKALKGVSRELGALGMTAVYVYGSVARGTASAASDIDLAYQLSHEIDLDRWVQINRLLEEALGKVVDAHRIEPDELPPRPFTRVWTRRKPRRSAP
jgi:predicted nucleotidyltransferase